MIRYRLFDSPTRGLYLHKFLRSDLDVFHSHPWQFVSLPLSGGYLEEMPTVYPDWEASPEDAAAFYALLKGRYDSFRVYGPVVGDWEPGKRYEEHAIARYNGAYYGLEYARWQNDEKKFPGNPDRPEVYTPADGVSGAGWQKVDPDAPQTLHVKPFQLQRRAASHVHRVKLFQRQDGTEIPALTLIWRGPKSRVWGFWKRGVFTQWREFFRLNGC